MTCAPSQGRRPDVQRGRRQTRRNVEQMLGIGRRSHAVGENEIIARALTFHMQTPRGEPDERIEPVQSTGDLRQQLHNRVAAFDVREFVQQHRSQLLIAPLSSRLRQQQPKSNDAPDDRNRSLGVNQQTDRLTDVQAVWHAASNAATMASSDSPLSAVRPSVGSPRQRDHRPATFVAPQHPSSDQEPQNQQAKSDGPEERQRVDPIPASDSGWARA